MYHRTPNKLPQGEPWTFGPPFEAEDRVAITPKSKYIKILCWNVNTWNNIKPYVKGSIAACYPDVVCVQEPRVGVSLPNFTPVQSKLLVKVNSAILVRNGFEFKELYCSANVTAVEISLRNNVKLVVCSLYLANPLD